MTQASTINFTEKAQRQIEDAKKLQQEYDMSLNDALRAVVDQEAAEDQYILQLGQYYQPYADLS